MLQKISKTKMCECCEKLLIATKSNGEPLKVFKEKQPKKSNVMVVSNAERSEEESSQRRTSQWHWGSVHSSAMNKFKVNHVVIECHELLHLIFSFL